jgi:predicted dehydrogenase
VQGLGLSSENFKRLSINGTMAHTKKSWFPEKGYDEQMQTFVDCIRNGTQTPITVMDGIRATIGCIRMMESAKQGRPMAIDLAGFLKR